ELGPAVVDGRPIDRAQDSVRHVGRTGDLQEMPAAARAHCSGSANTLTELPRFSGTSKPAGPATHPAPVSCSPLTTAMYCRPSTAYVIVLFCTVAPSGSDSQRISPVSASNARSTCPMSPQNTSPPAVASTAPTPAALPS